MDALISKGVSEEALPCEGCRAIEGKCPVLGSTCATFDCANAKGVSFCSECNDFPCMKLAPAADKADVLPHNTKLYNLCVVQKHGMEALIEQSSEIR